MGTIAVYKRVSTDKQDTDMQNYAIEQWLKQHRPGATFAVYADEGMSGRQDQRPAFQRLQADIKAGKVETVVVYRLDRLTRKASTALRLLLDWLQGGIEFFAVEQPILNASKDDPFRLTKLAMFSELAQIEHETIVARVKAGLRAAKARGVRLGALPKVTDDQAAKARQLRATGAPYKTIARELQLSPSTVHKICNP